MVLYELLTGTTPLDGEQLRSAAYGEMQRLIREETPPKPSTRVSTISRGEPVRYTTGRSALQGDLDWIVMKALEKERDRRYETANALTQDLERHLRDEPVSAGPPSTGYRLKKFVRRNRRSLLSGVAAAVALLIGLAVAGGVWLNATVQESERLTLVEGKASTLISQIEQLMEQNAAADYDDDSHFRQVLNLVTRLENLVGLDAPEKAEQLFRRAQRENPESFWANCTLGNTLGDLPDSSNTSSGPAYGMDGMPAQYWELNGGSERGLKFDERIGFLRTAVAIRPDAAGAWSSLGNSLRNGGRLEEAAASLQRAIKLNPNMASVHSDLGKFDKAIASYRKAIELDPKFAMAHNNLGLALVLGKQGTPGEVIASYRKAIALDPDLLIAHRSLCVALMARGKLIEAEKPLRECLRLTPDPPMQSDLELTLTLDRKLLGVLQKHGVGHPSVSELVQPILLKVPFLPVRQDLVRKFWEGHPAEVLRELEQRTLTVARMLFLETRKRVKHLPVAEQVPLVRHDDLGLVALDPSSWQIW